MSENNSQKENNSENELSELLDDALKDFEDPTDDSPTPLTEIPTFNTNDNFLKESFEETMKSFMNGDEAEITAGLQELIFGEGGSDLQNVIQESLKSLSDAKQNLPEGSDMTSLFANMQDDVNLDEDMLPMIMQFIQPLMNKETLYPSIKDLSDKFPKWLEDHQSTFNKEELNRYVITHFIMSNAYATY